MKILSTIVVAAALTLGTAANAATFSLTGGTYGINPGANNQTSSPLNNVLNALSDMPSSIGGFFGSQIEVNNNQKVLIEVFGWQAAYDNQANIEGTVVGSAKDGPGVNDLVTSPNTLSPVQAVLADITGGGLLDLTFSSFAPSCCGTNTVSSATNGSNLDATVNPGTGNGTAANFFVTFGLGKEGNVNGNSLWVFYDDDGVPGDNHDDLVIRISAVPLPAGMLLMLTGLGALAARRRMS